MSASAAGHRGAAARSIHLGTRVSVTNGSRVEVSPLLIDFGKVDLGTANEVRGALIVHVFSAEPWSLVVSSTGAPSDSPNGGVVPLSRLKFRTDRSGDFVPLSASVEIARGSATPDAGTVFVVDLRFSPDWNDSPGSFDANLDFTVNPI